MRAFGELSRDKIETKAKVKPPPLSGVEQSEEILEWIWENFSAVAGTSQPLNAGVSSYSHKLREDPGAEHIFSNPERFLTARGLTRWLGLSHR